MTEIIKETITRTGNTVNPTKSGASDSETIEYMIYFFFGTIEIILAFRVILKAAGASMGSAFVNMIYFISRIFVAPFEGIFHRWFTQGLETTAVFEPSTLIAIAVYAVLAWGIVRFVRISSGEKQID